jgi:hypothetical protein
MLYRILAMASLLLGLPLLGCGQPTMGDQTASSPQAKISDREKTDKQTKAVKETKKEKEQDRDKKGGKPLEVGKVTSLKEYLDKHHYRWSDEKEADFPLIIELQPLPAPEEIKGPFPENAAWRTEEKAPEKKAEKSFWPWN